MIAIIIFVPEAGADSGAYQGKMVKVDKINTLFRSVEVPVGR